MFGCRQIFYSIVILCIAGTAFGQTAPSTAPSQHYVPGELIIGFKNTFSRNVEEAIGKRRSLAGKGKKSGAHALDVLSPRIKKSAQVLSW